jgi:hypothetical protein
LFITYSTDSTRKFPTQDVNWFWVISLSFWCLVLRCYHSVQHLRNLACIHISSIVWLLGWLEVEHNSIKGMQI